MNKRGITGRRLVALVIIIVAIIPWVSCAQTEKAIPPRTPNVLYINSYHPGYPWSDSLEDGIFEVLHENVLLYTEYLDAKRPDYKEYANSLLPLFSRKYENIHLSAILTSDDAAFEFVTRNRNTIFKDVPVVACGINFMSPEILNRCTDSTGVSEGGHPLKTLQLAMNLFPENKQVIFITDYQTGDRVEEQIAHIKSEYPEIDCLTIRQTEETSVEEVISRAKKAAAKAPSIIFNFGLTLGKVRMDTGADVIKRIADIGPPVFVQSKRFVEYGALGGIVQDGRGQGAAAAEMVLEIINGKPAEDIPPIYEAIDQKTFNYERTKHFRLLNSPLLNDAEIINAPDQRFALYRKYLLGGTIFIGMQAALIAGLIRLIRDRKRSATQLRQSEENLRITLSSIADAVITTDTDRRVRQMNKTAERLTGWTEHDARGRLLEEILHTVINETRSPVPCPVDHILSSGKSINPIGPTTLISKDGSEWFISDSGAPILDPQGLVVGAVLVIRDVSEEFRLQQQLQQSEERLRQSEKMEAIGQLAGGVAHDFNNQLMGILGFAELLREDVKHLPTVAEHTDDIIQASKRAADLTSKLLAFARKGKYISTPVDLHTIIAETIGLLSRSVNRNLIITEELRASPSMTKGDPSQLQNAILNLALNARDAMPDGGKLKIETDNVQIDADHQYEALFDMDPGPYMRIKISDSGTGMSPQTMERIFEPFYTTKTEGKGTGLGLAAVYGTLKNHGGGIAVESEPGTGTTFSLFVKTHNDNSPTASKKKQDPYISVFNKHIMLVEDEEALRRVCSKMLQKMGCTVTACSNGAEAVATYEKNGQEIDAVILDLIMPEMDGTATCHALKKLDPNLKIILASGYAIDGTAQKLLQEGANDFIQKPFSTGELNSKLSKLFA